MNFAELESDTVMSCLTSLRSMWGVRRLSWGVMLWRRSLLRNWGDPLMRRVWRHRRRLVKTAGTVSLMAMATLTTDVAQAAASRNQLPQILQHVDKLYEDNQMQEALVYLEPLAHWEEAEVLWRLARLCYKVGKYHTSSQEQARELAGRGIEYANRSVTADSRNFACHKWMGIVLSWASDFEGYRRKIERSFEIRDHFLKAIEQNPADATCRHLLGQWCYSVASVPWYQRQVASVIFATPPSSSYEEALSHFEAAEKVDPGFYVPNWLFLGKCHMQLGHKEEAQKWLMKASEYPSELPEIVEAKVEATDLLKKLR